MQRKVKKQRNYILLAFLIPLAIAILFSCSTSKPVGFKDGQILLPDYVHTDTLIVTNGRLLNTLFEKHNPATDKEISDILAKGTKPFTASVSTEHYAITCSLDTIYSR